MIAKVSMGLVLATFMIGCGTQNDNSSLQDINTFKKGVYAKFGSEVASYRISTYKVKEGNIKDLITAEELLAIQIKDINLIKNAGGSISYAQGGKDFGVSGALLEFIDKNEGYGPDGDMRCGDVQQGFDVRTAKLLAKLYLELSGGQTNHEKFWEAGFHVARAWKKRLCGDKYNPRHWESASDRSGSREDANTIVPPGSAVSTREEKASSTTLEDVSAVSSDSASISAGAVSGGAKCLNSSGEALYAEGSSWPNEPSLVCQGGNWIWR